MPQPAAHLCRSSASRQTSALPSPWRNPLGCHPEGTRQKADKRVMRPMAKRAGRAHAGWWGACLLKGITASAALEPASPGEASAVASATYRAGTWGSGTAPLIPLRSSNTGERVSSRTRGTTDARCRPPWVTDAVSPFVLGKPGSGTPCRSSRGAAWGAAPTTTT